MVALTYIIPSVLKISAPKDTDTTGTCHDKHLDIHHVVLLRRCAVCVEYAAPFCAAKAIGVIQTRSWLWLQANVQTKYELDKELKGEFLLNPLILGPLSRNQSRCWVCGVSLRHLRNVAEKRHFAFTKEKTRKGKTSDWGEIAPEPNNITVLMKVASNHLTRRYFRNHLHTD